MPGPYSTPPTLAYVTATQLAMELGVDADRIIRGITSGRLVGEYDGERYWVHPTHVARLRRHRRIYEERLALMRTLVEAQPATPGMAPPEDYAEREARVQRQVLAHLRARFVGVGDSELLTAEGRL